MQQDRPSLEILARYLKQDCTLTERARVEAWLSESDRNAEYLHSLAQEWTYLRDDQPLPSQPDRKKVWQYVLDNIQPLPQIQLFTKQRMIRISGIAASIALILGMGGSWLLKEKWVARQMEASISTIIAPKGQKTEMLLPDGSKVWLNAGSKLTYAADYDRRNRTINLDGEAFFDVVKDEKSPFIVRTKALDVVVKGTAFDVSAYEEDGATEVSLLRGKVEVLDKSGRLVSALQPNELLRYDKKGGKFALVRNSDAQQYSTWIQEELIFENATMEEVSRKLERWYGVQMQWEQIDQAKRYTFKIKTESLRELLQLFDKITPISYTVEGKSVKIRGKS